MIRRYIQISLLFVVSLQFGSAQESLPCLIQCRNENLFFDNGDSLKLSSNNQLIILLFHAEQDTIGLDPGLSIDGRWRAINLMKLFKSIPSVSFFTTPFRNNILTIQPLVDAKKTAPQYYDQADIQALTTNISNLYPNPVMVMVHPETVGLIFEHITKAKLILDLSAKCSEKIILIQRDSKQNVSWKACTYRVR